ncbi:hypothetical protein SLH46_06485 [Draconibacterium sp. IB214405]|uniref:hypothetical protein n=1 Tax=Draconibacterium sp. IB214405 TaxID=3097352 RepID=UPI002A101595|nr:hypothetical protein [Draconibacterium sp. IB214405]MDX8338820.1 hypothetical protein [Draconibacterium sp. IB214405]
MISLLKYTGVVFGMLFCLTMQAQDLGIDTYQLNSAANNLQGKMLGEVHVLSSDATYYFLYPDDWVTGSVTLMNGNVYENLQLRYHAFEDELIAYNENGRFLFLVEKELVESFSFEDADRTRKFIRLVKNNNQQTNMYLEELYKADISLLVNWYIYEQTVSPYVDRNGITRAINYVMHKDYYLYTEKNGLEKIRLKKRSLFLRFPEHKTEIRKIIRKNHMYINNEASMVKVLGLMQENGLLE